MMGAANIRTTTPDTAAPAAWLDRCRYRAEREAEHDPTIEFHELDRLPRRRNT
jgi:hypothetical protein